MNCSKCTFKNYIIITLTNIIFSKIGFLKFFLFYFTGNAGHLGWYYVFFLWFSNNKNVTYLNFVLHSVIQTVDPRYKNIVANTINPK